MSTGAPAQWDRYRAAVAALAHRPADDITDESRLVEDLGLDSLGLVELAVILQDDFGVDATDVDLAKRTWEGLSAGDLFRACRLGSA